MVNRCEKVESLLADKKVPPKSGLISKSYPSPLFPERPKDIPPDGRKKSRLSRVCGCVELS